MAQTFWPFPKGSAGSQVAEPQWSLMARNWLATGVLKGFLNELAVTADGTTMQVNIDTGAANIMGAWFKNDASIAMPIAAADPTNPRIDVIAIRVDWVANTIAFVVLEGTPAASPVAPSLTQTDILITPASARWEIALANVTVPAGATTIVMGNVADKRTFTAGPTSTPTSGATAQYNQSGSFTANALIPKGLTGATAASRYVGATTSGAPTSGAFAIGDFVIDQSAVIWICTVAGTPGTWKTAGVGADTWHQPTLQNGWTNYGTGHTSASYKKDTDGFVYLSGLLKPGTLTNATTIFQLPAGYRPLYSILISAVANNNSATTDTICHITIGPDGTVSINEDSGSSWLNLDGIVFRADQ